MDTVNTYQLKNIASSLAIGVTVLVLSILIVSTIVEMSPADIWHRPNLLVIVITSAVIASFVSFGDRALSGLFSGICLASIGAILNSHSQSPHYYATYIFGIILGSLFATYPVKVILITLLSIIIMVIIGHWDDALIFIPSLTFSSLLLFITHKTLARVYSPLQDYLSRSAISSLAAFITMYIFIILFFALTFSCANRALPGVAFKSSAVQPSEMSYGFFIYFSTITIGTVGYGEVVPGHWITRILTSVEVVIGTVWIVVYFAFLMRKLSDGA